MDLAADTIETLFRRESRRLISVLTRLLGPQNLQLAEDVVQEAFVAAMRDWSANGVPDNLEGDHDGFYFALLEKRAERESAAQSV